MSGNVTALTVSTDRLWIVRRTGLVFGGELFVDLLDPETLATRRSIAVSRDLTPFRNLWHTTASFPSSSRTRRARG